MEEAERLCDRVAIIDHGKLEIMRDTVRTISRFLPLTDLVALLRGLWFGEGWGDFLTELAVLVGVGIVGTLIVARTFRWE